MILSRSHVVGATVLLATAAAGCGDGPEASRPLPTFGPESLRVAFVHAPDTLGMAGPFTVTAAAYNRTRGLVAVLSPCAEHGLRVRVVGPSGYVRELDAAPCGGASAAEPTTLPPGDSIVATLSGIDLGMGATGVLRLEASYVATAGQSAVVERPLVVRNALACPSNDIGIRFALDVAVRDAASGAWLPATVVATDGGFREVLGPEPGVPGIAAPPGYYGVAERPGTYRVTVSAAGYEPWTQQNVVVVRGTDCHVRTVSVVARLDPSS